MDNFEKLERDLSISGELYAENKTLADHLERTRTALRSELMIEHIGCPVNERQMRAEADPRYKTHLEAQKEAEHLANVNYVKWNNARIKIENLRTRVSFEKAKMNLI